MQLANPLRQVVDARYLGGHTVWLRFDDGVEGQVELAAALRSPALRRLREASDFSRFDVDGGTLVWPGGLDIAPERLYELVCAQNGYALRSSDDAIAALRAHLQHVPEISRFFGIVIQMLYDDHEPPHFHARYGEYVVSVTIADGIVTGVFPKRALRMVLEWQEMHADELMENWHRSQSGQPPRPIAPLA
jgi:hypothetical protein